MLEKVPGDVASGCWPYLVAKSSHVGIGVDRLAYPLHHPTTYNHQTRGQGFLPGVILSRRVTVHGGALLGDAKAPDLDICGCIDHLDTCVIEFYMEHIAFTRICLPYVGIIMVCMHVSLVELPFQTVMGWIPALECMLSDVRGHLVPCPISSGSERFCPPRP
jgi:hypothetical protein